MKTRQKSDRCVVAEGIRKFAQTQSRKVQGGAKATTVTKEMRQLNLRFGAAETQGEITPRTVGKSAMHQSVAETCAVLLPNHKKGICPSARMARGSPENGVAFGL